MNRFEGLSLPELMDLLHDIVVPEPVPWWPQTQGWWVAGTWLLAVILIGLGQWIARRRHNRYRRDAEAELDAIAARADAEPAAAAADVAALVKRTALVAYPRGQVAALSGADWSAFLRASADDDRIVSESAQQFADAAYRADADGRGLIDPARRWIRVHRV